MAVFPRGAPPRLSQGDYGTLLDLPYFPHSPDAWLAAFAAAGAGSAQPRMRMIRALRQGVWSQTAAAVEALQGGFPPPPGCPAARLSQATLPSVQVFAPAALPPAPNSPDVAVLPRDVLAVAGEALRGPPCTVAVLCMASASHPGGGVLSGRGAQEESLHRRTDLCRFTMAHPELYPIAPNTLLYARGVTVLRGTEDDGYPFLADPFAVDVLLAPAVRSPVLAPLASGPLSYAAVTDYDAMLTKVLLILRSAVDFEVDVLVLSAFGCGAYGNPPDVVAQIFAYALSRVPRPSIPLVLFAVMDDHNAQGYHCPFGNFATFRALLHPHGPHVPPHAGRAEPLPPLRR